jgi:hypothetical protein
MSLSEVLKRKVRKMGDKVTGVGRCKPLTQVLHSSLIAGEMPKITDCLITLNNDYVLWIGPSLNSMISDNDSTSTSRDACPTSLVPGFKISCVMVTSRSMAA